jgi:AhpD family alkylhydroperoxidase
MRVTPRPLRRYPWYLRPFFWNQRRKYGAVLDSALLWGLSPRLFLGVAHLYGAIDRKKSPLEPALRSLVTVRVSQLNGCRFCVDLNSATLVERGVPFHKVEALGSWRERNLFNERERVALEYAEAMTLSDREVDDGLMEQVRRQFNGGAIVELTALIAFQNMSSKFNSALGVPAQGFCQPEALTSIKYSQDGSPSRSPHA